MCVSEIEEQYRQSVLHWNVLPSSEYTKKRKVQGMVPLLFWNQKWPDLPEEQCQIVEHRSETGQECGNSLILYALEQSEILNEGLRPNVLKILVLLKQ